MAKKKNATREDGRISVQVYLGRDEDGKRQYKTVYGTTQKEADEKALQVKLAMRKGIDVTAEQDTFEEWAARWAKLKATEVSTGQMVAYKSAVKHLNGAIGNAPITKLKASDYQSIILDLAAENPSTGRPTARQTLKVIKATAAQIVRLAIENRVLDFNPVDAVKIPINAPRTTKRALTDEEQKWIIDTPHRARRAAMIMMYAGLRRGEVIALTWADIDLDARTIRVNKAAELIKGAFVVKPQTKTNAGMRTVDIPDALVRFLRGEKRNGMIVCPNTAAHLHNGRSWTRMWESYLKELNIRNGDFTFMSKENGKAFESKFDPEGVPMVIPHITPHWLRHTFITNMYLAGVDIVTAQQQAGHSDVKTMLAIYTHLDAVHKRRAMDKMNAYFDGCKSDASQPVSSMPVIIDV